MSIIKGFLHAMGFGWEKRETVETTFMLPTASGNDDGKGWKKTWDEDRKQEVYQREVYVTGSKPKQPGNWNEGSPGVWHRSD